MPRPSTTLPTRSRNGALVASLEWYDFFVYATAAALIFGKAFFPGVSPVTATLAAFATFGAGFAVRPLGGLVSGHVRHKPVLMAAAMTLIGVLPTYSDIGVVAPVLLVLLRILLGLVAGDRHDPGGQQVGVPIGMVLGNTAFLAVVAVLSSGQFEAWGWRVPFLFSVVPVLVTYYVDRMTAEAAPTVVVRRAPVIEVVRQHSASVLFAASVYIVLSVAFYILAAGLLDYGTRTLGVTKSPMLLTVLVSVSSMVLTLPVFAALSGRKPVFAVGAVATGMAVVAVFPLLETLDLGLAVLGLVITVATFAIMYGPQAALFAEMFPPNLRAEGAALGYRIANVIGGGLAPFVMVLLLGPLG